MRRLLRWAFNGAAAASAVLLVGLCLAWAQSGRVIHVLRFRGDRYLYTAAVSGRVGVVERVRLPDFSPSLTTGHLALRVGSRPAEDFIFLRPIRPGPSRPSA